MNRVAIENCANSGSAERNLSGSQRIMGLWRLANCILIFNLFCGIGVAANDSSRESEIDVAHPPYHLRHSALFEFTKKRRLSVFPNQVEDVIQELIYVGASPVRFFIPRGRSAQAPNTDEREPRIMVTSHSANKAATRYPTGGEDHTAFPGTDYEGRLFMGFSKRIGEGEILSWNRKTHQFDFFVVSDMGRRNKPRVREIVNRATCTRCHQEGGPVFSLAPWSESMAHDPDDRSIRQPAPAFVKDPTVFLKDGVLISGEATPLPVGNNTGLAGDSASVAAVRIMQASKAVRTLCRENLQCRRFVLSAAIFSASQSSYIHRNYFVTGNTGNDFQDIDFIITPLNVLRAFTNPNPAGPLIVAINLPAFLHGLSYLDGFKELATPLWPKDNFAFITHLVPDPTMVQTGFVTALEADPASPRNSAAFTRVPSDVLVPYFYDVAFEALGFNYQDSLRFQAMPLEARMAPLQLDRGYIPRKLERLLINWPPSREAVLEFYGMKDTSELETPLDSQTGVSIEANQLPLFEQYCARCHKGGGDGPAIPFDNVEQLRAWNKNHSGRIVNRLTTTNLRIVMPPNEEPSNKQPTQEHRDQLQAFFQSTGGQRGTVYTNYLGVRVQNVRGQKGSYIVPDATVSIDRVAYTDDCGQTVESGPPRKQSSVLVGIGSDGKSYLALENFPHYFPGNIVQLLFHKSSSDQCYAMAISRIGRLIKLGFNHDRRVLGSISFVRDSNSPKTNLSHIASGGSLMLAIGKDGNIYRVQLSDSENREYQVMPITMRGVSGAIWSRVGFKKINSTLRVIAESSGRSPRRVIFELNRDPTSGEMELELNSSLTDILGADFIPSLLDRESLLLNPS